MEASMAPSRMKSRKLGLEEEASGGGGQTVSSPSEAKKMYVFISHQGWEYDYSLFALGIPSPGTIVKTKPTVVTTPSVKGVEPERSPALPILRFSRGEGWTSGMRCILLGQKLYFLGGHYDLDGFDLYEDNPEKYPTQVYALDLSQEVKSRDRNKAHKIVEQVASMNTGKDGTIVSFVADGKIFLVSSRKKTNVFVPFEIFDASENVWKIGAEPPFGDHAYLYPPLVFGRKVLFCGEIGYVGGRFTCCYTIDDERWSDYCVTKEDDYFGVFNCSGKDLFGGVVVGESTLWNVRVKNNVPAVVRLDITNKKQVKKTYFGTGLRYYIEQPARRDTLGTSLAAAEEDSRRLCFLQVDDGGVDPTRMSVILFERGGGGRRESPKYLTSAHYFVKLNPGNPTYCLIDAHIV